MYKKKIIINEGHIRGSESSSMCCYFVTLRNSFPAHVSTLLFQQR